METEPLMNNQGDEPVQPEAEVPLVPRNRPDVYTASELLVSLMVWSRPIMDVLTWQLPIVSSSWLILGLVAIYFLTSFSLPSLLGLLGLTVMGLVMLYAAIRRVEPYQELRRHPMLAEVRVPPEAVDLVAELVTTWLNRWVATGQYLFFSHDYRPSVLVSVSAFYLIMLCAFFGSTAVLMMAYCFAFILPKCCLHWSHDCRRLYQLPGMNVQEPNEDLPDVLEDLPDVLEEDEENIPDEGDDTENQQPEVNDI